FCLPGKGVSELTIARKVAVNTGIQIFGQVLNHGIGMITSILLIRYLGPTEFGKYAFVTIYIAMFGMINNFGMGTILARDIAKNKTKADCLIGNAILLKSLIALITMSFSIIIISLLRYP
nr:oligosaccharide flippase family protein [Clostridia bacterium]